MGLRENLMFAARLHGAADLRLERVPIPRAPKKGEVIVRVKVTGLCGSDLHLYKDGRIGDTEIEAPLIIGHEFSGVVEEVGEDAFDGYFEPIKKGVRVAVDPARPCGRCELCLSGNPNLCINLQFCGNYPCDGCLCEYLLTPSRCCFPVPDELDDIEAALLEPLGVAIHSVDLAKIRVKDSVAILGAGPIGLLILQVARVAGANPIFVTDKFDWRLELASKYGALTFNSDKENIVDAILKATNGRGVDVAIEAAWGEETVIEAGEIARNGGRVVLVGIPSDDKLMMKHSTARRKGLTILLCRRMKLMYPRAIALVKNKAVDLKGIVTHRFKLTEVVEAFRLNAGYSKGVIKVMIEHW